MYRTLRAAGIETRADGAADTRTRPRRCRPGAETGAETGEHDGPLPDRIIAALGKHRALASFERSGRRITQSKLAEQAHLSKNHVGKLLRRPRRMTARILGILSEPLGFPDEAYQHLCGDRTQRGPGAVGTGAGSAVRSCAAGSAHG